MVTGANGFIGLHLLNKLNNLGIKVNAVVRNKEKLPDITEVNIFEGDLFNKSFLKKTVDSVDTVFHLAAKTHDYSKSKESDAEYFRVNIEGTKNLLDACVTSNVKHFVYFSSVKAMAEKSNVTIDESYTPTPTTPYGETKLAAEKMVFEYGKKYGFKATVLRLPLVYGPGNKGNIYKLVWAIDRGIFFMVGKGENRRSMVYIDNVIDAAISVAGCDKTDGQVFIVTDGVDYSVKEICATFSNALKKKPPTLYLPLNIARLFGWIGDKAGVLFKRSLPFNSEALEKFTGSYTLSSLKIQNITSFKPKYNLFNTAEENIRWYKNAKK